MQLELEKLAAFIKREFLPYRNASTDDLIRWLRWFSSDARCVTLKEGRRIVGVCLGRCISAPGDEVDQYRHDEDGPILFIDMAVGPIAALGRLVKLRFGNRKRVRFFRRLKDRRVRDFNFNSMERIVYGR